MFIKLKKKGKKKDDSVSKRNGYIHKLKLIGENYIQRVEIKRKNNRILSGSPMPVFS